MGFEQPNFEAPKPEEDAPEEILVKIPAKKKPGFSRIFQKGDDDGGFRSNTCWRQNGSGGGY